MSIKYNTKGFKVLTPDGYKDFKAVRTVTRDCLKITTKNKQLECSINHPICVNHDNMFFVPAIKLCAGDKVYTKSGYQTITKIEEIGKKKVYDLISVDTNHYFTNGILSHNCIFDQIGDSGIEQVLIEKFRQECFEPSYILDDGKYLLWDTPKEDRIYVVGVDIAEGVSKDYTVAQILDITNLRSITQVGMYASNTITPQEFTPKLYEILQHWGRPLVAIERNNCGAQVVDNLKKDFNYENIINYGGSAAARQKRVLGIIAHTNTKYAGVTNQRYWVNTVRAVKFNDIKTVIELSNFVRLGNGSWGSRSGEHDDRVMALTWALAVLMDDLVMQYFEVSDKDENHKPLIIKQLDYGIKYFVNPTSMYTNERNNGVDALPVLMGNNTNFNDDLNNLTEQGWRPLYPQ